MEADSISLSSSQAVPVQMAAPALELEVEGLNLAVSVQKTPRGRGRPPGSRNKFSLIHLRENTPRTAPKTSIASRPSIIAPVNLPSGSLSATNGRPTLELGVAELNPAVPVQKTPEQRGPPPGSKNKFPLIYLRKIAPRIAPQTSGASTPCVIAPVNLASGSLSATKAGADASSTRRRLYASRNACSIFGCPVMAGQGTAVFKFPPEAKTRKEWEKLTGRAKNGEPCGGIWRSSRHSVICERHFDAREFTLVGGRKRLRDRETVLPTLNLPKQPKTWSIPTAREIRRQKRAISSDPAERLRQTLTLAKITEAASGLKVEFKMEKTDNSMLFSPCQTAEGKPPSRTFAIERDLEIKFYLDSRLLSVMEACGLSHIGSVEDLSAALRWLCSQ